MPVDPMREEMSSQDKARLTWRRPTLKRPGAWSVRFENSQGELQTWSKGLQVPSMHLDGSLLNEDEQVRAAQQVMKKAKREWNRLDCSEEERFVI